MTEISEVIRLDALKKFCNEDYSQLRTVQGLKASPDGKHALYAVQQMDPEKDAYRTYLWVMDLETGREFQLTGGGREGGAFWLDGWNVVFSSSRGDSDPDKESVFYRIDIRGGEAMEYMRVPVAGAQASPLGEGRFLVRAMTSADAKEEEKTSRWMFFNEYPCLEDGLWYASRQRRSLFLWNSNAKELRQLTAPLMQTYVPYCSDDVILAEDGFFFVGYEYDRDAAGKACICKYTWENGETRVLCEDSCYVFSFARREGRIYFGAWAIEPGPAIASIRIKSVSESGGDLRTEAAPQWELGNVRQQDGRTVFTKNYRAQPSMARWQDGMTCEECPTPGVFPTCAIPVGEDIVFTGWEENRLPEVYRYRDGQVTRLSHQNDRLYETYTFSAAEPLSVIDDGFEICGWVMKPANFVPGKRYPGILNIHGGPHGYVSPAFSSEHQRWANEGYFVFFCNPRGSTTYGLESMNVSGRLGEEDFHNLMAFTDKVLEVYPELDGSRLGITGQSYGGIMTNWAIGHTDRFKAAVPRMSASNWLSMHGTSRERWYGDNVVAGTPWDNMELVWRQSALKYVDQVKTPTLFIQHEKDQSCPMEQAQQMFTALLERGVPTKMMVNLGCFHGGRSVSQLLHDIDVMLSWFGQYLGEGDE